MEELIEMLHQQGCSCVIRNRDEMVCCHRKGIRDIFDILETNPNLLKGAEIADKVVGKGAAALMVIGGVERVYADVISEPALRLFVQSGVDVSFSKKVDNIINRLGTGICPVESLCRECESAQECLPLIKAFLGQKSE